MQFELFPISVHLTRINSTENMERYYSLTVTPDLFGGAALLRSWGRIGRSSTTRIELHQSEGNAVDALLALRGQKERRGYSSD